MLRSDSSIIKEANKQKSKNTPFSLASHSSKESSLLSLTSVSSISPHTRTHPYNHLHPWDASPSVSLHIVVAIYLKNKTGKNDK